MKTSCYWAKEAKIKSFRPKYIPSFVRSLVINGWMCIFTFQVSAKKKNFMTFHIGMRRFLRKMQDYQNFGEPKIMTLTNQVLT